MARNITKRAEKIYENMMSETRIHMLRWEDARNGNWKWAGWFGDEASMSTRVANDIVALANSEIRQMNDLVKHGYNGEHIIRCRDAAQVVKNTIEKWLEER